MTSSLPPSSLAPSTSSIKGPNPTSNSNYFANQSIPESRVYLKSIELLLRRNNSYDNPDIQISPSQQPDQTLQVALTMSSSLQIAARRVATLQIPRTIASSAPRAAFSTSIQLQKSATETAKDALKTVDRAVSDKLVDGIDIGGRSPG